MKEHWQCWLTSGDVWKCLVPTVLEMSSPTSVVSRFLSNRYEGHGFPRVCSNDDMGGFVRRGFWLLLSLGLAAFMIWQIQRFSYDFAREPVYSTVEERRVPLVEFPRVMVCPTGFLSSLQRPSEKFDNLVKGMDAVSSWGQSVIHRMSSGAATNFEKVPLIQKYKEAMNAEGIPPDIEGVDNNHGVENWTSIELLQLFGNRKARDRVRNSLTNALTRSNTSDGTEANRNNMVLSCEFSGFECGVGAVFIRNSPCFLFIARKYTGPGSEHGLVLSLQARNDVLRDPTTRKHGYDVSVVHDELAGMPEQTHAPLGQQTTIELQRSETFRINRAIGGKCHFDEFLMSNNLIEDQCIRYKIRAEQERICNCSTDDWDCDSPEKWSCIEELSQRESYFQSEAFLRDVMEVCTPNCQEVGYHVKSASTYLDPLATRLKYMIQAMTKDPTLTEEDFYNTQVYNTSATTLTEILVYFGKPRVQEIREHLKYGPLDLLGNLGGIIGLTAGMSLLTLFQWMELLLDLVLCGFNFGKRNHTDDNPAKDQKEKSAKIFDTSLPATANASFPTVRH